MKIVAITSFNQKYYDLIGKDSVDSFLRYWPTNISITCYIEDMILNPIDRLNIIDFSELCNQYQEFQNSNQRPRVKIFAKKAYSIIHAMENIDCDFLIWLDADTITTQQVNLKQITSLCQSNDLATFMGVYHNKNNQTYFSAETGFFILNKNHKGFTDFSNRYREYYDKRLTEKLRRFYDGEVFGAVVKDLEHKYEFNDMCLKFNKQYKTPLRRTTVGKFLHHYKAKSTKDKFIANKFLDD